MSETPTLKICPVTTRFCTTVDCAWFDQATKNCAVLLLAIRFDAVTTGDDELAVNTSKPLTWYLGDDESCSHT